MVVVDGSTAYLNEQGGILKDLGVGIRVTVRLRVWVRVRVRGERISTSRPTVHQHTQNAHKSRHQWAVDRMMSRYLQHIISK